MEGNIEVTARDESTVDSKVHLAEIDWTQAFDFENTPNRRVFSANVQGLTNEQIVAKVDASMAQGGTGIPHSQVMDRMDSIICKAETSRSMSSGVSSVGHVGVGSNMCQTVQYHPVQGDVFQITWLSHVDRSYIDEFFACEASDSETVVARMLGNQLSWRNRPYVFRKGDVLFIRPSHEVVAAFQRLTVELADKE